MATPRKKAYTVGCVDCGKEAGIVAKRGRPPKRCPACNVEHRRLYLREAKHLQRHPARRERTDRVHAIVRTYAANPSYSLCGAVTNMVPLYDAADGAAYLTRLDACQTCRAKARRYDWTSGWCDACEKGSFGRACREHEYMTMGSTALPVPEEPKLLLPPPPPLLRTTGKATIPRSAVQSKDISRGKVTINREAVNRPLTPPRQPL